MSHRGPGHRPLDYDRPHAGRAEGTRPGREQGGCHRCQSPAARLPCHRRGRSPTARPTGGRRLRSRDRVADRATGRLRGVAPVRSWRPAGRGRHRGRLPGLVDLDRQRNRLVPGQLQGHHLGAPDRAQPGRRPPASPARHLPAAGGRLRAGATDEFDDCDARHRPCSTCGPAGPLPGAGDPARHRGTPLCRDRRAAGAQPRHGQVAGGTWPCLVAAALRDTAGGS